MPKPYMMMNGIDELQGRKQKGLAEVIRQPFYKIGVLNLEHPFHAQAGAALKAKF